MNDRGLSDFKTFNGHLSADGNTAALTFRVRIDLVGEVALEFVALPLTDETRFIDRWWQGKGSLFGEFALVGRAEDGTTIESKDVTLTSAKHSWSDKEGHQIHPEGGCSTAVFRRKLDTKATRPVIRRFIKGFQNLGSLHAASPLGPVAMDGQKEIGDPNVITGWIVVQAAEDLDDFATWRAETERLIEHIRRVMSFASAAVLRAPILEVYHEDELEIVAWSQTKQSGSQLRTFHFLDQQPVFDAAIDSFFNPPIEVKNLFFAIEWFAMDSTYNEVRLVNAMTALENLLDSNLSVDEIQIQPRGMFDRTRRVLKKVIAECLAKWTPEQAEEAIVELNEKLNDLNRRSLLRKLEQLAIRWSVPLSDLGIDRIRSAKQARDRVIHRGQYYENREESDPDLWEHITIIREVVTRFLLIGIGYRGRYISYVGGYHNAEFPPAKNLET